VVVCIVDDGRQRTDSLGLSVVTDICAYQQGAATETCGDIYMSIPSNIHHPIEQYPLLVLRHVFSPNFQPKIWTVSKQGPEPELRSGLTPTREYDREKSWTFLDFGGYRCDLQSLYLVVSPMNGFSRMWAEVFISG